MARGAPRGLAVQAWSSTCTHAVGRYRAHAARLTAERARAEPSGLAFFRVLAEELQKASATAGSPPRGRGRHNFAADGLSARASGRIGPCLVAVGPQGGSASKNNRDTRPSY